MATVSMHKIKAVPRWVLLPIVLSVIFHLLFGSALPQYMTHRYKAFEEEVNRAFQPIEVKMVKPVTMEKVQKEAAGKSTAEARKPDINHIIDKASTEIKPFKDPTQSTSPEAMPENKPVRRKWNQENYPIVSRQGIQPEVNQDILGVGSKYGQRRFGNDVVARVTYGGRSGTGTGQSRDGGAIQILDEGSLTASIKPTLDFRPQVSTQVVSRGTVKKKDSGELEGYRIPSVKEEGLHMNPPTAEEMIVAKLPDVMPIKIVKGTDGSLKVVVDETWLKQQKDIDERFLRAEPLAPDVTTDFKVYREPGNPNSFFRLSVKVKKDSKLPVIQKNVLLVIDVSLSVKPEELDVIRSAVHAYLKRLNPQDKFNVVRFSEDARRAFFTFVPPTEQRIAQAIRFIKKTPGQTKTDVYDVLHSVILNIFSRFRPCTVFLISDGKSTQGVRDSRRIVREIAPITRSNISIYTVDVGPEGNHYLLDLVAYRSRGEFLEIDDPARTSQELNRFGTLVDRPVLMGLGINYANLKVDEVYPQILSNLYRDKELVIYGQCEPGRECAVQILGQSAAQKWKKFIYPMKVPETSNGDASIAREWARGKIHYLVARLARGGPDPKLVAEVIRLGTKYNLPVPFTKK